MIINEHILKITGSASLDQKIDTTKRLRIKDGELDIYSVERKDNQDGTFNLVYKGKFCSAIEIAQYGNKITGKPKGSRSQVMRRRIIDIHHEGDDNDFYHQTTDDIIYYLPEIYEWIQKRKGDGV